MVETKVMDNMEKLSHIKLDVVIRLIKQSISWPIKSGIQTNLLGSLFYLCCSVPPNIFHISGSLCSEGKINKGGQTNSKSFLQTKD